MEERPLELRDPFFSIQVQTEPARVKLYDVTRGLPRRIEAQYRRHWAFVPGLWNLYFREQVNIGVGLRCRAQGVKKQPVESVEQDAAMAAAGMYPLLQKGFYRTQSGALKRIDGDMTKLRFAVGMTTEQQRLLADFKFRTRNISGTQEIRTKIGHLCFWGSVVYGNGIFMTISPGERHNHLAVRLSRYRARDPYIVASTSVGESDWIGSDKPSLRASAEDVFHREVPGYDLRKLIQSRGPLAPALAFSTQVRVVLASLLGLCKERSRATGNKLS